MKIPKSFKQFGQEITVKFSKDLSGKQGLLGKCYFDTNEIELQDNKYDGINLPDSKMYEVFLHELLHLNLYFAGEHELRNKEQFVDIVSGLQHQAFTTAVYDDED